MTRFILSLHKLAFPHILQPQLCIKIPHPAFRALAAVAKEIFLCCCQRFWLFLCRTKSGIINSATFCLLLCISNYCNVNLFTAGSSKGQGTLVVCNVKSLLSFPVHSFKQGAVYIFSYIITLYWGAIVQKSANAQICCAWCFLTQHLLDPHNLQFGLKNHVMCLHRNLF